MSKKELLTIINEVKSLKSSLTDNDKKLMELSTLVFDVSRKLDAILNTAGSKKPVSFKKTKYQPKSLDEKKCFNVIVFFKHFYQKDEKKFDRLWEKGEKKKILDEHKKEWEGKNETDKRKIQINILYKTLSKESRAELQKMKKNAQSYCH